MITNKRKSIKILKKTLDPFLQSFDPASYLANDPVEFVRRFKHAPKDAELFGLLCSSLAFGRVAQIRAKIAIALSFLENQPTEYISKVGRTALIKRFQGFQHRWIKGEESAILLFAAYTLQKREGSLGNLFQKSFQKRQNLRHALGEFRQQLYETAQPISSQKFARLLPNVYAGSACKRLLLFLRWMVRKDDGIDLGLWKVPTEILIIPVDTHVARIGHYIGLSDRQDASWKTAEEMTKTLQLLDPVDPVKYDFALCHFGISGNCPKKRHPIHCQPCPIQTICRL